MVKKFEKVPQLAFVNKICQVAIGKRQIEIDFRDSKAESPDAVAIFSQILALYGIK